MTSQSELEAILAAPALKPPDGVDPVFNNPPNRNGLAMFVTIFCLSVSTVCVAIRSYARMWQTKRLSIEEVFMFLAFTSMGAVAYASFELIKTPGYYVHQWNLHNRDLVRPLYLILLYGCFYSIVLPLVKTAILLDWSRVFVIGNKTRSRFWWCCMGLIGFQCLWGFLCVLLLNLQCRPHVAIWEFYLPSECYPLPRVMLASAGVQVATDVCMVLLPQRMIWSLQFTWQRKVGIALVFSVGLIACIAACFRLSHTVAFANEPDSMFLIGPLLFWAWAEMSAGFFILCMPCLPKLVVSSSILERFKSWLSSGVPNSSQIEASNPLVTFGGGWYRGYKPEKATEFRRHYGVNLIKDSDSKERLNMQS